MRSVPICAVLWAITLEAANPSQSAAAHIPGERAVAEEDFAKWSPTPPMGWNSWDCYGPTVTEEQYLANVDVLPPHGSRLLHR